jgi:hypothetical protein
MKRFARILAVAATSVISAGVALHAQTDYSTSKATSYLTIGPSFSGGASMIFSPPEGSKVVPLFAWRGAADATYPLSPSIGAALGLGFEARSFRLRSPEDADSYTNTHYSYFMINPGFRFAAFYVGVNFGFPMSGSFASKAGTVESSRDMTTAEFDSTNVLIEPKVGAVVEIMNDKTGWLGLTIMGTVSVSELAKRGDVSSIDNAGDFHAVSGQIGLTYQFAIPGTKHH